MLVWTKAPPPPPHPLKMKIWADLGILDLNWSGVSALPRKWKLEQILALWIWVGLESWCVETNHCIPPPPKDSTVSLLTETTTNCHLGPTSKTIFFANVHPFCGVNGYTNSCTSDGSLLSVLLMLYATSGWIPTFNSEGVEILVQCSSKTNRNLKKENSPQERIVWAKSFPYGTSLVSKIWTKTQFNQNKLSTFVEVRLCQTLDLNSTRLIPRECHCRISPDTGF